MFAAVSDIPKEIKIVNFAGQEKRVVIHTMDRRAALEFEFVDRTLRYDFVAWDDPVRVAVDIVETVGEIWRMTGKYVLECAIAYENSTDESSADYAKRVNLHACKLIRTNNFFVPQFVLNLPIGGFDSVLQKRKN